MKRIQCKDIPVAEIVAACRACHQHEGPTPDEALAHKYPVKVILAKMAKLVNRGVLNYGVSLRTAWVVEDEATYKRDYREAATRHGSAAEALFAIFGLYHNTIKTGGRGDAV